MRENQFQTGVRFAIMANPILVDGVGQGPGFHDVQRDGPALFAGHTRVLFTKVLRYLGVPGRLLRHKGVVDLETAEAHPSCG